LGELRAYPVYEHELERLAEGTPASLFLNFALFLLPISLTLMVTFATTNVPPGYVFQSLVCVCGVTLIAGVVLFALWFALHRRTRSIIDEIKSRMPPEAIAETDPPP
jgi:hypothetical protein